MRLKRLVICILWHHLLNNPKKRYISPFFSINGGDTISIVYTKKLTIFYSWFLKTFMISSWKTQKIKFSGITCKRNEKEKYLTIVLRLWRWYHFQYSSKKWKLFSSWFPQTLWCHSKYSKFIFFDITSEIIQKRDTSHH